MFWLTINCAILANALANKMARPPTRLYLITPPQIDLDIFAPMLEATLAAGDVACLQLRLKTADGGPQDHEIIGQAIDLLKPIALAHDVAFLINDSPALAKQYDCDGVHIGQQDGTVKQAREILGADKIIGVTCHNSRHLAMTAGEAGADYVAFGAFYPTQTKQVEVTAELDLLSWWQEMMEPPCLAIGGITVDNAAPLITAGADFLAISSGIWNHPEGPEAAVIALNQLIGAQFATLFDKLDRD